ncbi:hypothetical protein BT96DRAFT_915889, partial [Gymnopus androsaceus JB14]
HDMTTDDFLANEPCQSLSAPIAEKTTQILVDQFKYLRNNTVEPLSKFFGLCYSPCVEELYQSVLVETPLARYFRDFLSTSDLDNLNIKIILNTVYEAYLEDFYFLDGMSRMLASIDSSGILSQLEDRFFQTKYCLKEQEIRNITCRSWSVSAQNAKDRIQDFIPIF